jgi:hypothetical protein
MIRRAIGSARRVGSHRRSNGLSLGVASLALWATACPAPLGGWDVASLVAEEPALTDEAGKRLGDLIPYPAPDADGLSLLACRWPSDRPIPVRLELTGPHLEWATRALVSLSEGSRRFEFVIESTSASAVGNATEVRGIDVVGIVSHQASGPIGVGDTLVGCDVSDPRSDRFGSLTGARIEMRAFVRDQIEEPVEVSDVDWTAAFLHELGHALGFQGHVRGGASILVRDQTLLRRAGRAALAGRPWPDPTLDALYTLEPGHVLGRRALSRQSQIWVRSTNEDFEDAGHERRAVVGDRHARLEWRSASRSGLELHLPFWPRQVRSGEPIVAFPGTGSRAADERPTASLDSGEAGGDASR